MKLINIKQLEKQKRELEAQIKEYYDQLHKEQVSKNEAYIGKTFKRENDDGSCSFYKIIGCLESNKNRMNTFIFTLPFNMEPLYDGSIDCELAVFDTVGWFCNVRGPHQKEIDLYTEIEVKEFNARLDEWFQHLKKEIIHET